MAAVTPSTDLYLLQCPIEIDNRNQINFSNATAQYNYFSGLNKIGATNFSYQRKDSTIRYPAHIDTIRGFNYVMYRNDNYSNKWFYAFIESMEYLNDSTTLIKIKTDVYQTWQFDLTFKRSYVVREHVNDDTVGAHTIPEGLEYGHYICNERYDYKYAAPNDGSVVCCFQVTTTDLSINNSTFSFPHSTYAMYNGLPQGLSVFGFELTKENTAKLFFVAGAYDGAGKGNAIVAITLVPKACCSWEQKSDSNGTKWLVPVGSTSSVAFSLIPTQTRPTSIDGYTPVNKKLLTSPYNYLYVSNNNGADVTYRYEDFNGAPSFALWGSFEQGGAMYLSPQNSKISIARSSVTGDGFNEGIPACKLPNLSWSSDYYLNWQAVNGKAVEIQMGLDMLSFAGSTIGGIVGGAGGNNKALGRSSGLMGMAQNVLSTAQQVREAKMTPPQAKGNVAAGSFAFCDGQTKFTFRKMSIKQEYARVIDGYFSAYGYKVNTYKTPNITGRQNWNYVETRGCNILGNVPQEDLDEIKAMFDSGVTIWHNTSTFLDYSQNNAIV